MFLTSILPLVLSAIPLYSAAPAPAAAPTPPNIPSASAARTALAGLTVAPQGPQDGYSRSLFPHWITIEGACNTRETVLNRDGTDLTIDDNCYPVRGNWYSPFDGARWTQASDVDIDHVVPLSNAWKSGARDWTTAKRRGFANDLVNPQLIAVTDNVNQEKGDKGPEDWRPPLLCGSRGMPFADAYTPGSYHCTYSRMWIKPHVVCILDQPRSPPFPKQTPSINISVLVELDASSFSRCKEPPQFFDYAFSSIQVATQSTMPGAGPHLYSFDTTEDLALRLRKYLLQSQNAAIKRHNVFRVAVSGGSLPAILAKAVTSTTDQDAGDENTFHLSAWDIFFADERVVPLDHPDSNYNLLKTEFIDKFSPSLGTPKVHPIDTSHLDDEDPQETADLYQEDLMRSFAAKDSVRLPVFDLILLGCGPDGHTCSLFPGHELLSETAAWVAPIADSPKPPPKRITLTLPVVTHGLRIAFVATGEGKRDVMRQIFDTDEGKKLPCGLVNEMGGEKVTWFTDTKATEGVVFPRRGSL
ncbi:hypothetical protein UREG_06688 [Uncinocarpus reesii 1704]|uniref:6-phosphogluconolactonase n=1 Tax=Uncinocarpus reesii (strain UAMH 1704) TaxID=336963 RepID=C4JVU6_UNCRE|nr:uncharacterized protein UREG_06688 [Uncinocarpus reesii 1704]EEP81823.1 hypothetical protein UREG_06688 [Uncinocarpus reesii 1704]